MELLIAFFLFLIAFILFNLLWSRKTNIVIDQQEAERCLAHRCQLQSDWHSQGRVYTKGLALIENNKKLEFIEQAKRCDVGLLS